MSIVESAKGVKGAIKLHNSKTKSSKSGPLLPTNFLKNVTPLTLAWHNIRVTREKPTHAVILDGIHGKALPNEVVALMGSR